MFTMLLWRLLSFVYNHFDTSAADVNVGIVFDVATPSPHGLARIRLEDGSYITIAFIVDKPRVLFLPSKLTVAHLFNQFSKMGLYCQSVKIKYGFWTEIQYQRNKVKELVMLPVGHKRKEYVVKTIL